MTRRFLQSLGALTLALLLVAALVAVIAARQSIRVQFGPEAEPEAARGPDPLALLVEDVRLLRADVDAQNAALSKALGETLPEAMRSLGEGLREDSKARAEALRAELVALRGELAAQTARLGELTDSASGLANAAPPAVAEPESGPEPAPQPEVALAPEPEPEPEPPGASFLAFELPSRALDFEAPLRFAIVPNLSRVGFDATSTLHDFTGATHAVAGEIETVLARPGELSRGSVRVEAATLDTGDADRDEAMREHLGVAEHPELVFAWTSFAPESVEVEARRVRGVASGELTIHGVTRAIEMPVRVGVDAGRRLTIEGETRLDMNDFGVEVPKKLGVIKVDPNVKIWIALRARHVGAAKVGDDAR